MSAVVLPPYGGTLPMVLIATTNVTATATRINITGISHAITMIIASAVGAAVTPAVVVFVAGRITLTITVIETTTTVFTPSAACYRYHCLPLLLIGLRILLL